MATFSPIHELTDTIVRQQVFHALKLLVQMKDLCLHASRLRRFYIFSLSLMNNISSEQIGSEKIGSNK